MCKIKKNMRDRARDIRRLTNALTYDADCVFEDVENNDLWCLGESMHETKITLQRLMGNVIELEYYLYLVRRDSQLGSGTPLAKVTSSFMQNNDN